eukprot:5252-Rhodomonas_salina.1
MRIRYLAIVCCYGIAAYTHLPLGPLRLMRPLSCYGMPLLCPATLLYPAIVCCYGMRLSYNTQAQFEHSTMLKHSTVLKHSTMLKHSTTRIT